MRAYLIFATAGLGLLMYSIDATVVAVAFPRFIDDFHTNVLWAAWTISIYYIAVTVGMPFIGKLSDSYGRKRVFIVSLLLFTGSSLACGLSPGIGSLILFRFLQGLGGASFLPTASGIVSDHFPRNRERAIGLFSTIFPLGGIIGPNIGGWIVSRYSWRFIFYVNLPIGLALIVLILLLLKGTKASTRPRVDLAGAALMSASIVSLMLGLNLISENLSARSLPFAFVFLLLFAFLLAAFLRREKKEREPFFDLTLLRSKPFLAANVLNMIIGAAVFGVFAFVPLYATAVCGLSTLMSGVILTPRSFGAIPASALTSVLLKKWGYRRPVVLGLVLVSTSTMMLGEGDWLSSLAGTGERTAEVLSFLMLVSGLGMGITFPAANNACIELMPDRVATIVGLRGMFRTIGGALGISIITLILHLSGSQAAGFRISFASFGIALLVAIPLSFLMPSGRKSGG